MKIGLIGLAGAGKDTFAVMLQEALALHGREFKIDRYAGPLKDLASKVFGLTLEQIEDREIKEKPIQFRRDEAIDHVFHCLQNVLKFNDTQMDDAAHLYFETFQGSRAMSPREFLQLFGTEVVRRVDPDAWRNRLQNQSGDFLVPDVRFGNEVLDFNILIKRYTPPNRPEHSSEHLAWDLCTDASLCSEHADFIIFNTDSLEKLKRSALACANHLIKQGA